MNDAKNRQKQNLNTPQQIAKKPKKTASHTSSKMKRIIYKDPNENKIISKLEKRNDVNSLRLKRLLNLPDLTRKENSPIKFIIDKILGMSELKDFDLIDTPEITSTEISFDLFDFASDHPARKSTDTYFADEQNVLRTHTTIMWYYYLMNDKIKERIKDNESMGSLSFGKVYRKDEIDRNHFPVFHQIDGWYLCPKEQKIITAEDLQNILIKIAQAVFGPDVKYRFNKDSFPYTDPSLEMEIERNGKWLEVLGSGVVKGSVLEKLGVDSSRYNGWAFGFGIERLAMLKMNIPDIRIFWSQDKRITSQFKNLDSQFEEVSKFPSTDRDISFIIDKATSLSKFYEIVRDYAENLIEEVKLLDKYENEEKFGKDKISYTFRIIYRSHEKTLTNEEINNIQEVIRGDVEEKLGAVLR